MVKAIEEEEFDKLSDEIKQQYEAKSVLVQEQIMTAISQIKEIERQSDKKNFRMAIKCGFTYCKCSH